VLKEVKKNREAIAKRHFLLHIFFFLYFLLVKKKKERKGFSTDLCSVFGPKLRGFFAHKEGGKKGGRKERKKEEKTKRQMLNRKCLTGNDLFTLWIAILSTANASGTLQKKSYVNDRQRQCTQIYLSYLPAIKDKKC
jgi:hypothetical protein